MLQRATTLPDKSRQLTPVVRPALKSMGGGEVSMGLGVKGIVYFELEARGGPWGGPAQAEIHGSYKSIVDAPVLRLAQALASLTTPDGNTILIPGYYEDVRPPSEEEWKLRNGAVAA